MTSGLMLLATRRCDDGSWQEVCLTSASPSSSRWWLPYSMMGAPSMLGSATPGRRARRLMETVRKGRQDDQGRAGQRQEAVGRRRSVGRLSAARTGKVVYNLEERRERALRAIVALTLLSRSSRRWPHRRRLYRAVRLDPHQPKCRRSCAGGGGVSRRMAIDFGLGGLLPSIEGVDLGACDLVLIDAAGLVRFNRLRSAAAKRPGCWWWAPARRSPAMSMIPPLNPDVARYRTMRPRTIMPAFCPCRRAPGWPV